MHALPPIDRPGFAVVREDPSLEAHLLATLCPAASAALVVASGGCTALSLAARSPALHVAAFDRSPRQLAHVRAKQSALRRGDAAAIGLHTRSPSSLHQSGTFEALFRLLRAAVVELITPDLDARFADPAALLSGLRASPYWPALFATYFADPMLHAMFGPAATQHAVPGSYPLYFQRAFERGLAAADARANYFLRHVFVGDYAPGCAPDFLDHLGLAADIELVEGALPDVPELARFGLISLSNIFDWSDDALVTVWADHLARHARPGAVVLIRQLNNQRDLRPFFSPAFAFDDAVGEDLLARDRSLFYNRVLVGVRA